MHTISAIVPLEAPSILLVSASYGRNCFMIIDAVADIATACDGLTTCDFPLSGLVDADNGCVEEYEATYRCGTDGPLKSVVLNGPVQALNAQLRCECIVQVLAADLRGEALEELLPGFHTVGVTPPFSVVVHGGDTCRAVVSDVPNTWSATIGSGPVDPSLAASLGWGTVASVHVIDGIAATSCTSTLDCGPRGISCASNVCTCSMGYSGLLCEAPPARSCRAWHALGSSTDGEYWIQPDVFGEQDPFLVHCDMTQNGGGWTLLLTVKDAIGWTLANVQRMDATPSTTENYSILAKGDAIRDAGGGGIFRYRIDDGAGGGGVWEAPARYPVVGSHSGLTAVAAVPSAGLVGTGLGPRMPYIPIQEFRVVTDASSNLCLDSTGADSLCWGADMLWRWRDNMLQHVATSVCAEMSGSAISISSPCTACSSCNFDCDQHETWEHFSGERVSLCQLRIRPAVLFTTSTFDTDPPTGHLIRDAVYHLAPSGMGSCDYGTNPSQSECEAAALDAIPFGIVAQSLTTVSMGACWGEKIPAGCSVRSGGNDWTPHFNTAGSTCPSTEFQLVCRSGKRYTTTNPEPPVVRYWIRESEGRPSDGLPVASHITFDSQDHEPVALASYGLEWRLFHDFDNTATTGYPYPGGYPEFPTDWGILDGTFSVVSNAEAHYDEYQLLRGWFVAPLSGTFSFLYSFSGTGSIYFSPSERASEKVLQTLVDGKFTATLSAGHRYWLEALSNREAGSTTLLESTLAVSFPNFASTTEPVSLLHFQPASSVRSQFRDVASRAGGRVPAPVVHPWGAGYTPSVGGCAGTRLSTYRFVYQPMFDCSTSVKVVPTETLYRVRCCDEAGGPGETFCLYLNWEDTQAYCEDNGWVMCTFDNIGTTCGTDSCWGDRPDSWLGVREYTKEELRVHRLDQCILACELNDECEAIEIDSLSDTCLVYSAVAPISDPDSTLTCHLRVPTASGLFSSMADVTPITLGPSSTPKSLSLVGLDHLPFRSPDFVSAETEKIHLAAAHMLKTAEYLSLPSGDRDAWLGVYKSFGNWYYADGLAVGTNGRYVGWGAGEPRGSDACAVLSQSDTPEWESESCSSSRFPLLRWDWTTSSGLFNEAQSFTVADGTLSLPAEPFRLSPDLTTPPASHNPGLSLSLWLWLDAPSSGAHAIIGWGNQDALTPGWSLRVADSVITMRVTTDERVSATVEGAVAGGAWIHVGASVSLGDSHTQVVCLLDGVKLPAANGHLDRVRSATLTFPSTSITIGPFEGKLDNLQLWTRPLTLSQLRRSLVGDTCSFAQGSCGWRLPGNVVPTASTPGWQVVEATDSNGAHGTFLTSVNADAEMTRTIPTRARPRCVDARLRLAGGTGTLQISAQVTVQGASGPWELLEVVDLAQLSTTEWTRVQAPLHHPPADGGITLKISFVGTGSVNMDEVALGCFEREEEFQLVYSLPHFATMDWTTEDLVDPPQSAWGVTQQRATNYIPVDIGGSSALDTTARLPLAAATKWCDYKMTMSTSTELLKGWVGFTFRFQDIDNHYVFAMGSGGSKLTKRVGGVDTDLASNTGVMSLVGSTAVTIHAIGTRLSVHVRTGVFASMLILQAEDASLRCGTVGIGVKGTEAGQSMFEGLSVSMHTTNIGLGVTRHVDVRGAKHLAFQLTADLYALQLILTMSDGTSVAGVDIYIAQDGPAEFHEVGSPSANLVEDVSDDSMKVVLLPAPTAGTYGLLLVGDAVVNVELVRLLPLVVAWNTPTLVAAPLGNSFRVASVPSSFTEIYVEVWTADTFSTPPLLTIERNGVTSAAISVSTSVQSYTLVSPNTADVLTLSLHNTANPTGIYDKHVTLNLVTPAPQLSTLQHPDGKPAAGGVLLLIFGSDFAATMLEAVSVTVDGVDCPIVATTATSSYLECTLPAGTGAYREVQVISLAKPSNVLKFHTDLPKVTSILYSSASTRGSAPVRALRIYATNLGIDTPMSLILARITLDTSVYMDCIFNPDYLLCVIPPGQGTEILIRIRVDNRWSQSNFKDFNYDPPTITALEPDHGPTSGGDDLVIVGTNFGTILERVIIMFDGASIAVTDLDISGANDRATVSLPAGEGAVTVSIEADGQLGIVTKVFTYDRPSVTALEPSVGDTRGTILTINATNLGQTLPLSVKVGPYTCESPVRILNDEAVQCQIPEGVDQNHVVKVAVGTLESLETDFKFSFNPPTITLVSPPWPAVGGRVTITGDNFGPAPVVVIDKPVVTSPSLLVVDHDAVEFIIPAGYGGVRLSLSAGLQSVQHADYFYDAPEIDSVFPLTAPTRPNGGVLLTINGRNYGFGTQHGRVTVDGAPCPIQSRADDKIECTLPQGMGVLIPVVVSVGQLPDFASESAADTTFAYEAPVVSSWSAQSPPTSGGTLLELVGYNFGTAASVEVGGQPCLQVGAMSDASFSCTLPPGQGTSNSVIITTDAQATQALELLAYEAPTIISIVPDHSPTQGGVEVIVSGTNFSPSGSARVFLDAVELTPTFQNTSHIIFEANEGINAKSLQILVSDQGAYSTSPFTYDSPTITSVSGCTNSFPATSSCALGGDTPIVIAGLNLGYAGMAVVPSVSVGGQTCTAVNPIDAFSLTCKTPALLSGNAFNVAVIVTVGVQASPTVHLLSYSGPTVSSIDWCPGFEGTRVGDDFTASLATGGDRLCFVGLDFGTNFQVFARGPDFQLEFTVLGHDGTTATAEVPDGAGAGLVLFVVRDGIGSGDLTQYSFSYLRPVILPQTLRLAVGTPTPVPTPSYPLSGSQQGDFVVFDVEQVPVGNRALLEVTHSSPPLLDVPCEPVSVIIGAKISIRCRLVFGQTGGPFIFVVRAGNQWSDNSVDSYTYPIAPVLTGITTPGGECAVGATSGTITNCPSRGGARVLIQGSGFCDFVSTACLALVQVGSEECTDLAFISASSIECTLPSGTGLDQALVMQNDERRSNSIAAVSYAPPVLDSVSGCTDQGQTTINCPRAGNHRITLRGSNFGASGALILVATRQCASPIHGVVSADPHSSVSCLIPAQTGLGVDVVIIQSQGQLGLTSGTISYQLCEPGERLVAGQTTCVDCLAGRFRGEQGLFTTCETCPAGYFAPADRALGCDPCGPGEVSSAAASACTQCGPGTYAAGEANTACKPCGLGRFNNISSESFCPLCEVGRFAGSLESEACADCTAGQYAVNQGSVSCQPCPTGSFSPADRASGCTLCLKGTANANAQQSTCKPCLEGTFADEEGLSQCLPCDEGWVANETTSEICFQCRAGRIANVQRTACVPCAAGEYTSVDGRTSCLACGKGRFTTQEASTECEPCPPGTAAADTGSPVCTNCTAGKYAPGQAAACLTCDVGFYQPNPTAAACLPCPVGRYRNSLLPSTRCDACPPGTVNNAEGQMQCTACTAPTMANGTGNTQCRQCAAGYFVSQDRSSVCTPCEEGRFGSLPGALTCKDCGLGTFLNQTAGTECTPCDPGFEATEFASLACVPCVPGFYALWPKTAQCSACEPGTIRSNATDAAAGCVPCAEGSFQSNTGQSRCQDCGEGTTASTPGSTYCVKCDPGRVNNLTRALTCRACDPGRFQAASGRLECELCPTGKYQTQEGQGTCIDCPAGTITNATGRVACAACAPGYSSVLGASKCSQCIAGRFASQPGTPICQQCPSGSTAAGLGFSSCTFCQSGRFARETGSLECSSCAKGTFAAGEGKSSCVSCEAGRFQNATGADRCEYCPIGQSQGGQAASTCQLCVAGRYAELPGAVVCTECAAGFHQSGVGSNGCVPCDEGFAQGSRGQAHCVSCPRGLYADGTGRTVCESCGMGSYTTETNSTQCLLCAPGRYQSEPGQSACIDCAPGTVASRDGTTSCVACEPGRFSPVPKGQICQQCQEGFYQPQTGQDSCVPCAPGNYQPQPDQDKCEYCLAGKFSAVSNATQCSICPAGRFQAVDKEVGCDPCPPGKFQGKDGSDVCEDCSVGRYLDVAEGLICKQCPVGKKQQDAGKSDCDPCGLGFRQPSPGQDSCQPCDPGKYSNTTTSTSCFSCDPGRAQPNPAQYRCETCTPGRAQSSVGAEFCLQCDPGYFSPLQGEINCTACPPGYANDKQEATQCEICPEGKKAKGRAVVCEDCDGSSVADAKGSSECQPCGDNSRANQLLTQCVCEVGFFLEAPDKTPEGSLRRCVECITGMICIREGTTWENVETDYGWWRKDTASYEFLRCIYPAHCEGGRNSTCGHERAEALCATCKLGYKSARLASPCEICPPIQEALTTSVILCVVLAIGISVFFVVFLRLDARGEKSGEDEVISTAGGEVRLTDVKKAVSTHLAQSSHALKSTNDWQEWYDKEGSPDAQQGGAAGGRKKQKNNNNKTKRERGRKEWESWVGKHEKDPLSLIPVLTIDARRSANFTYKLKILVSFLQIGLVLSFLGNISWPRTFQAFMMYFSIVNLDFLPWQSLGCAAPETFNYHIKGLLTSLMPLMILLTLCCVMLLPLQIQKMRGKLDQSEAAEKKREGLRTKFLKLWLFTVYCTYPHVSGTVLGYYRCTEVNGATYMHNDFDLLCWDSLWFSFAMPNILFVLMYPVGIPVLYFVLLYRHREVLEEEKTVARFGFLYHAYSMDNWWFEMVDMSHKLFMTSIVVFFEKTIILSVAYAALCCFMIMLLLRAPYMRKGDLRLAFLAQNELLMLCLMGLVLSTEYRYSIPESTDLLLSALLIIIIISILSVFAVQAVRNIIKMVEKFRRRRAHEAAVAVYSRDIIRQLKTAKSGDQPKILAPSSRNPWALGRQTNSKWATTFNNFKDVESSRSSQDQPSGPDHASDVDLFSTVGSGNGENPNQAENYVRRMRNNAAYVPTSTTHSHAVQKKPRFELGVLGHSRKPSPMTAGDRDSLFFRAVGGEAVGVLQAPTMDGPSGVGPGRPSHSLGAPSPPTPPST